eukprot:TRINITY_DN370_c1_g1_i2.p2 TRINITY_DN370_c1_g1~~TRINITY_DN370_c1_g1_i2.p2  ORF type:complete len:176 (+),score=73.10 TRINITY_DN370_c1_g1_i2:153-680(+)
MGKCDGMKKRAKKKIHKMGVQSSKKGVVKRKDKGLRLRPSPKTRVNRQEKQLNVKVAKRLGQASALSENLENVAVPEAAKKKPTAAPAAPERLLVVPKNNRGGISYTSKDKRFNKAAKALSENLVTVEKDKRNGRKRATRRQVQFVEANDDDDDDNEAGGFGLASQSIYAQLAPP